ncbi:DUF924 family protein [Halofilum ochraceum]|uniref:DUF924 family protein n=1 Tax=Halofilum ochraceum TaxID=1611323 RepID=UPI000946902D|nr:DUF924 family protein [Halofilum ochraceum]
MSRAEGIHEFWFGALDAAGRPEPDRPGRWFSPDEGFDAEVRGRFEADLRNAAGGRLGRWERTPRGALALILLFDQFPRNMYRGTARAFLFDESARAVLDRSLPPERLDALWPIERVFAWMPLEHAEDRDCQARSVELFSGLVEAVDASERDRYEEFLRHAQQHREVIERFGRFPHRNAVLGRESTPEEREWLAGGAQRWGQA